jgi:CRISPR system Cascade subunit CasB
MPPDLPAPPDYRGAVYAIALRIEREDYPPGDLAQLRRLDPEAPDSRAFWALIARHLPAAWDDNRLQRALAPVVRGMAIACPFHRAHEGERRGLGRALAEAGVSEHRLLRLLRAGSERLANELRQLAQLVKSKGDDARFDWSDALWLILTADGDDHRLRRRIARDYYGRLFQLDKEHAA